MTDDFIFGNIVQSSKIRGWLYDLGRGGGVAITGANAVVVYLMANAGLEQYPVWLGATSACYIAVAPYVFGVSKANLPLPKKPTA